MARIQILFSLIIISLASTLIDLEILETESLIKVYEAKLNLFLSEKSLKEVPESMMVDSEKFKTVVEKHGSADFMFS
jgi:hypothetical protein